MEYSSFLNKYSKPIFRIGVFLTKSSIVLIIVGLILGILKIGWLTLFIALGAFILSNIFVNIPTQYIAGFVKLYDRTINYKEANTIAQNHLREPIESNDDTRSFVNEIIGTEGKSIKKIKTT